MLVCMISIHMYGKQGSMIICIVSMIICMFNMHSICIVNMIESMTDIQYWASSEKKNSCFITTIYFMLTYYTY